MDIVISDNSIRISKMNSNESDIIRCAPNRRWDKNSLSWVLPICRANIKYLIRKAPFSNNEYIREIFNKYVEDVRIKSMINHIKIDLDFSKYKIQPFRYQQEGILFCFMSKRAIIADEPGLGKTLQAIISADLLTKDGVIVVICPRSIVYNWVVELNKVFEFISPDAPVKRILAESPIYVASGFTWEDIPADKKWIICGYSQLTPDEKKYYGKSWLSYLSKRKDISTLVLDEVHKLKNPRANKTMNIRKLSRGVENIVMLSGTLMLNNAEELWAPLNIISPYDFSSKTAFCEQYMNSYTLKIKKIKRYDGSPLEIKKFYGVKNLYELKKVLSPFIIRRMKADVIGQLPPKRRIFVPLQIPYEYVKEYRKMEDDFIEYLIEKGELLKAASASNAIQLVQGTELMKFVSKLKGMEAKDIIEELAEAGKVVVFCTYKDTAKTINEMIGDISVAITGDDPLPHRQAVVSKFKQANDKKVLVMTYGIGAEGFSIEEASNMVIIDFNWVPAMMLQAEDRIHRVTSKEPVMIKYLYMEDTIDKVIYRTIKDKISDINKIFSLDVDIIKDFVEELQKEIKIA